MLDMVSGGEWSANAKKTNAMLDEYSKKKTNSLLKEYSKKWTLNVPGFCSLKEGQKKRKINDKADGNAPAKRRRLDWTTSSLEEGQKKRKISDCDEADGNAPAKRRRLDWTTSSLEEAKGTTSQKKIRKTPSAAATPGASSPAATTSSVAAQALSPALAPAKIQRIMTAADNECDGNAPADGLLLEDTDDNGNPGAYDPLMEDTDDGDSLQYSSNDESDAAEKLLGLDFLEEENSDPAEKLLGLDVLEEDGSDPEEELLGLDVLEEDDSDPAQELLDQEWPRRMTDEVDPNVIDGSISIEGKRRSVRLGNYEILGSFIDPDSECWRSGRLRR